MDIIDIFNQDAFGAVSLTEKINKYPYKPGRIGSMGLFGAARGITTPTLAIHEKFGRLKLIETSARGEQKQFRRNNRGRLKHFAVPHLEENDAIMADEVIGARLFGESPGDPSPAAIASIVTDKMTNLRMEHELTWEYHMLGAVKGQVLDADGTQVIYDWHQEFNVTKATFAYTGDLAQVCREVKRHMARTLGSINNNGNIRIHCFVGADFMDKVASDATVKADYQRYLDGKRLRDNAAHDIFSYQGIDFEEYLGYFDDGTPFVEDGKGHAFPTGTDRFIHRNAPADMIEAAGSVGLPLYSHQEPKRGRKGIDLFTQSNPIYMCTQPAILVEIQIA